MGLAVSRSENEVAVARVVFGPEPSDAAVLEWARDEFRHLRFRVVDRSELDERMRPKSPKRRQREAQRDLTEATSRTRAQSALASALEEERGKLAGDARRSREERAQRSFEARQKKRKLARRGK